MHITLQGVRLEVEGVTNKTNRRATESTDAVAAQLALAYRWDCRAQKGVPKAVETSGKLKLPNILVFSERPLLGKEEDTDDYASDLMKRKLVAATGKSYAECRAALQRTLKSVPFDVPLAQYAPLKPLVSFDLFASVYHDAVRLRNDTLDITAYVLIPSAVIYYLRITHHCNVERYGEYIDGHSGLLRPSKEVEGYSETKAGRQMRRRTLVERKKDSEAELERTEDAEEKREWRKLIELYKSRIAKIDEIDGTGD